MKRPLAPFVCLLAASRPGAAHDHHRTHSDVAAASSSASVATTPPPCPLHCENGGVCRHGTADESSLHPIHAMYSPIDVPFLDEGHLAKQTRAHCVCPAGYVGRTCSVALEKCGDGHHGHGDGDGSGDGPDAHHCFHGAPCRLGISDLGKEYYYCECSEAGRREDGGPRQNTYAGHMCQHASTVTCGMDERKTTVDGRDEEVESAAAGSGDGGGRRMAGSFCTNWGTCKEGGNGVEHPGCDCPEEWEGPNCQYRKGTDQQSRGASSSLQSSTSYSNDTSTSYNGTVDPSPSDITEAEEPAPTETRKKFGNLAFVIVAVLFSTIGLAFPQFVKWWRKRTADEESEGNPVTEVGVTVGSLDPDGLSMSSVSMSEAETSTVAGDTPAVLPPPSLPPPSTDVLV